MVSIVLVLVIAIVMVTVMAIITATISGIVVVLVIVTRIVKAPSWCILGLPHKVLLVADAAAGKSPILPPPLE